MTTLTARDSGLTPHDWADAAARFPLLSAHEETILGRAIREWQDHPDGPDDAPALIRRRGIRARRRMVEGNLRLVLHYVNRRTSMFSRQGEAVDRMQDGALGLQRAAEKYDPARGYRFSTYAFWWIAQGVGKGKASEGLIRVSENALASKVPATVAAAVAARSTPVPLDQPIDLSDGRGDTLGDLIEGGRLAVDDLAAGEALALVAELLDPDDMAFLELAAEGYGPAALRDASGLEGRTSVADELARIRGSVRTLPVVELALAG